MDEGSSRRPAGLLDRVTRLVTGRRRVTEEEIHDLIDAGEEEGIVDNLNVYPNPSKGFINIENVNPKVKAIEVYDISGNIQFKFIPDDTNITLNISNLPNGIYYVNIVSNDGIQNFRKISLMK